MKKKLPNTDSYSKHWLTRLLAVGLCSAVLIGGTPVSAKTLVKSSIDNGETLTSAEADADADDGTDTDTPEETAAPTSTPKPTAKPTPKPTSTPKPVVAKAQKIKVKTAKKTYKATWYAEDSYRFPSQKLGLKAKRTFKIGASAKTSLSYTVKKSSGSKYISVSKKGKVTLKKGTPKGTYKIKITAKKTKQYKKASRVIKITVKGTPHMKGLAVKWDLKNNKKVTYETAFSGNWHLQFFKSGKLTLKNYKKTSASKKGYKKVSFDIVFNRPASYTKKQIDYILDDYWDELDAGNKNPSLGNNFYVSGVDYETGESLEAKNKHHVTMKFGKWKWTNTKKFLGTGSNWITYSQTAAVHCTVTYPKNYKNLCIVAGGIAISDTIGGRGLGADDFFKGDCTFREAYDMYANKYANEFAGSVKHRKISHGLRVK